MEADFIRFDPASEFEVLETYDFEEEIQRPESLRFFTLDEQLADYFEKVLPKEGKITKFEYRRIASQVERLRDIYNRVVTVTDTDYTVDTSRKKVSVDWVHPIYGPFELTPYSYAEKWVPLFGPEVRRIPNYYPRMLSALPKPYRSTSKDGVQHVQYSTLVNEDGENPVNVLGTYERTKGIIHEDGRFTVVSLPIENTGDDIHVRGFFIEPRLLDIPKILPEHPFFASNTRSKYITNEPLERVFPTIETILTHGVPTTTDPYVEGQKYLKIYDVKLSQVDWNLWKERFPPAESVSVTPPIASITFPSREPYDAPSKSLLGMYRIPWKEGLEPRFWLSLQEDSGTVVSKMILTKASAHGQVPPAVIRERPESHVVLSTPDECFTFETFDSFINAGIYRLPKWSDVNAAINKGKTPPQQGTCIPMPQILQEQMDSLVAGKKPWKESTESDILTEYVELLSYYQPIETVQLPTKYEIRSLKPESDTRRQIKAILRDSERDPVDRAYAIDLILRGSAVRNDQWFARDDSFLICNHTLAILKGDMEVDKNAYYDRWAVIDEGYRSCKFCGEQINRDVIVSQDDFDEDGNVIISHDALEHTDTHGQSFTNSLTALKSYFQLENVGESIFYLCLSLLQVLPSEPQLFPILQRIRSLTSVIRSNKKADKLQKERLEGVFGVSAMVTLLLIHNPFLIPRRSFGSKVLKLSGFPRDTEDPTDAPALDTILNVLKTTFKASPNTFTGAMSTVLKSMMRKPTEKEDFRKEVTSMLLKDYAAMKPLFLSAKERYDIPIQSEIVSSISFPVLRLDTTQFRPSESISEERHSDCVVDVPKTYLTGKLPPSIVQESVVLYPAKAVPLEFIRPEYVPPPNIEMTEKEIRRKIALGFPKGLKLDKLEKFLRADPDIRSISSILTRVLDILSLHKFSNEKLVEYRGALAYMRGTHTRDALYGLMYEALHEIAKKREFVNALTHAVKHDLTFNMLLLTKEDASRQESDLRTREREAFKLRMRNMNDTEREISKMLLDIGIAPYVITNEDRKMFAREYGNRDPEIEYAQAEQAADVDRPEEGYNASRDIEDGEAPVVDGVEQQVDHGDYGDRREEISDRDYERNYWVNHDEGFGT